MIILLIIILGPKFISFIMIIIKKVVLCKWHLTSVLKIAEILIFISNNHNVIEPFSKHAIYFCIFSYPSNENIMLFFN